jgi:tRNA (cmo5U34)-methyltransferase
MMWKFDENVAMTFGEHAAKHIPDYHKVIGLSVDILDHFCKKDSLIADIGCAVGLTLDQLRDRGFTNLVGVDSSEDMLKFCDPAHRLIHSEVLPVDIKYDAILMNWTLHFISDKIGYLRDVHNGLVDNGVFILTEKVSLSEVSQKFYYDYKRSQGVSEEEIIKKQQSLQGVMHINKLQWYLSELENLGFRDIEVINAHWAFATIFCRK